MRRDLQPPVADVRFLVERALAEDLTPLGDLTSSLLDQELQATAEFGARFPGVIAGCLCVEETFAAVDSSLSVEWSKSDGDRVEAGEVFGVARGSFATLLTAERTALTSTFSAICPASRPTPPAGSISLPAGSRSGIRGRPRRAFVRCRRPRSGPGERPTTVATFPTG